MAIYTKTGDLGETSLANGRRVSKADARLEAYGTVDELNSWIGMLRVLVSDGNIDAQLSRIQNKLFDLGAFLSEAPGEWIADSDITQIEQWIDGLQANIPRQKAFVLPTGGEEVCRCHICRTVCRRAERRMTALGLSGTALQYINRLSDYLFVLSRFMGHTKGEKEEIWVR